MDVFVFRVVPAYDHLASASKAPNVRLPASSTTLPFTAAAV